MSNFRHGTYKVTFFDGSQYIFGNNYKPWYTHVIEFALPKFRNISRHQIIKKVEYSKTTFVDDGGLKYCDVPHYQEVIDEVSIKEDKTLLPFSEYVFDVDNRELNTVDKKLERW